MNLRLLKSEKGIGTIVAFIIFLMITILFMGGIILWQFTNQDQMIVLGKDRTDERISVQATWDSTTHNVAIKVSNIGTIDVEIIRLWILDMDHSHNNSHLWIDISYPLPVGGHTFIDEIDELITSFNDFNATDEYPDYPFNVAETTYYFKVVTARGNIANTLLMPYSALGSQWPAVIIPGESYVEQMQGGADIHLEVYNSLVNQKYTMLRG